MKLKLLITSCAFAFLYMGNVDAMDPVIAQAKSMKPGPRAIFLEQKYIELNGRYVELQRQPGRGPLPDADSFADVTQGVRDIHITQTGIDDVTSYHDTFEAVHGADTIAGLIAIAARQGSGDNHAVHDGVFEEGTNYGHLREYQTLNDLRTGNGGQPYQLLSAQLRGVLDNYNTLSGFQTFEALTGGGQAYQLLHQGLRDELGHHTTLFGFQSINALTAGGQAYQLLHQGLRDDISDSVSIRNAQGLSAINQLQERARNRLHITTRQQINKSDILFNLSTRIPADLYRNTPGLHITGQGFGTALMGIMSAATVAAASVHLESVNTLLGDPGIIATDANIQVNSAQACGSCVSHFLVQDDNYATLGYLRIIKEIVSVSRVGANNFGNMHLGVFKLLKQYIAQLIFVSTEAQLLPVPAEH